MFSMMVVGSVMKNSIKKNCDKSKKDIVSFSNVFSRDRIITFRNMFIQAIYRELKEKGISKIDVSKIEQILVQMQQRTGKFDPVPLVSTVVPISVNKSGKVTKESNDLGGNNNLNTDSQIKTTNVAKAGTGAAAVGIANVVIGGGTILDVQAGGAPLSDIFGTENYNLMAPICMVNQGTGLNNMVVRISKRVVQPIDTSGVNASAADKTGDDDDADISVDDDDRGITSEESESYVDI